jgi:hypothetical protein
MDYNKIVRSIVSNRNLSIPRKLNELKYRVNSGDYKEALKMYPPLKKFLLKDSFFYSVSDIYKKEPFQFTGDLKKEYRWALLPIEDFLEEINDFFSFKIDFETAFFLGNLTEAKTILTSVEKKYGITLWSIEANLLLEENINGTDANWNKLSFYLNNISSPFYEFIISSDSKRIESNLTYEGYLNQFNNDIENVQVSEAVKDFLQFRNFGILENPYTFPFLESVIYISNIYSVIDKYLILIDFIMYNVSVSSENDKLFLSFISKAKTVITKDIRLKNIYNIINVTGELIQSENNEHALSCQDNYNIGQFDQALIIAVEGIRIAPFEFEYYEIYCKSLVNLEKGFEPTNISTLVDTILAHTYSLLKFDSSYDISYKKLLKLCLTMMHTNLGKQIKSFLSETSGIMSKYFCIGILSTSYNTPKNLLLLFRKKIIDSNFKSLFANHSFKVFDLKSGTTVNFENKISTSPAQDLSFKAVGLFRKGDFKTVIEVLETTQYLNTINYYSERKESLLFYSYMAIDKIKDALILFGRVYFDDGMASIKIKYIELYNKVKALPTNVSLLDLVELPVLFSLLVKEYDLFEVYEDFMVSHEIDSIKDFDFGNFAKKFSIKRTIYFLENVVTIDTLKYSTDYGSINEVEEDRIFVLKMLMEKNSSNKLKYETELNEIYRMNSVRKVLKEVDEGRLYIDVNSLKEIQIKNIKDDFKRFKEIESLSSNQTLIGFNASTSKNWDSELIEKIETPDIYSSADYLSFKNIYLASRDNFLFSKEYGLDSCLSTRIRHGALKNHIRSVFEKLDLVTVKLHDKYISNSIWAIQLYYYPDLNELVQQRLKIFSKEIDNYTIFIVEKLIQIQTEKTAGKDDGLFKYFTNDEVLLKYYLQNKNLLTTAELTIEIILTNLVNYTLLDLQKKIIESFTKFIPERFQSIIEKIIADLRELNLPGDCQLVPNLIKSSTEIQNELENISNWFYLNTTSSSTLLSIETVIDASVELTNKINPNFKINPLIKSELEPVAVYSSLIFVFNILFNNILQHSYLNSENLTISLDITSVDEKYVIITVVNNVNLNHHFHENIEKLNTIKKNWNNHSNIDKSNKEGESGFDKIKRILIYETHSKTDKFDFKFENGSFSIMLYFPLLKQT